MAQWPTTLRIGCNELKLLVTSPEGDDLLKARLPVQTSHPRALLTLLEGVALWSGAPLHAVISASAQRDDWLYAEAWGEELWPPESPLVHFDFAIPRRAHRTLVRCPGCPPGLRPDDGFFGRALAPGPSLDGGFDEFLDDLAKASFSDASSACNSAICRRRSAITSSRRSVTSRFDHAAARPVELVRIDHIGSCRVSRERVPGKSS